MFSVNLQDNFLNISIKNNNIQIKLDWQNRQIVDFSFSQEKLPEILIEPPAIEQKAGKPEEIKALKEELRATKEALEKNTRVKESKVLHAEEKILEYVTKNQPCRLTISSHLENDDIKIITGIRDTVILHAAVNNLISKRVLKRVKNGFHYNYCLWGQDLKDTYMSKKENVLEYVKKNSPCIVSPAHRKTWEKFKTEIPGKTEVNLKILRELVSEETVHRERDEKRRFYIYSYVGEKPEEPVDYQKKREEILSSKADFKKRIEKIESHLQKTYKQNPACPKCGAGTGSISKENTKYDGSSELIKSDYYHCLMCGADFHKKDTDQTLLSGTGCGARNKIFKKEVLAA